MLAHAVCRVALLQEPRSIAIQRRTDDWQRCVATVKLGKQIKQHRVLSFPGAATCTRANDANNCRWGLGAEGTIAAVQLMKLEFLARRSGRDEGREFGTFPPQRLQMGVKDRKSHRILCDLQEYFLVILCRRMGYDDIEACVTYCDSCLEVFSGPTVRFRSKLV